MSPWLILDAGLPLQALLLIQGFRASLLRTYRFFYAYIASSLVSSLILIAIHLYAGRHYAAWYWPLQFITLITGYGILLELLNHVLAPYPGAERFARSIGLVAFGAIAVFALVAPRIFPGWSQGTVIEFERDLRSVQAAFICLLLAVVFYYMIPLGKNMKGMVFGYGLYIVTSLMALAARSYAGARFTMVWAVVQPLSYVISLVVWAGALWSYEPNPSPSPGIRLDDDYEALASKVRSRIGTIRSYFGRSLHL
jgi:hypothetical protein